MRNERIRSVRGNFKERLNASSVVFNIIDIDDRRWRDNGIYLRSQPQDGHQPEIHRLVPREFEALQCLIVGMTNKEIARFLSIDIQTVKNYCTRLYIEFDCQTGKADESRTSLIGKLIKEGVLMLNPRIPESEWVGLKNISRVQAA